MKRGVVTLVVWLVAIYAAICGAAYFGNRLLMYFPIQPESSRWRLA
jgi:hypothetical protein